MFEYNPGVNCATWVVCTSNRTDVILWLSLTLVYKLFHCKSKFSNYSLQLTTKKQKKKKNMSIAKYGE